MNGVIPKRQALEEETLKIISADMKKLLTKEQQTLAAKITREEQGKLAKKAQNTGSEEQWFNLYVLRVIMAYPRIVPLLKEMKAVQEPDAGM
jgi:CHASE3 domain sensor protein